MAWPLSQDYNEAIQTPAQCFSDPELRQGEAVCNAMGLPIPCSGNFADVYAVQAGQQKWAVKCFTRQIQGLRERYAEISKYLAQVRLPFMVQFTFLEQGIRVRGQWYPILKMQWVEGQTLNGFVKSQLDNPAILRTASQLWARMGTVLREANLAHGDLQHGNVLLVPGAKAGTVGLKLVDYDGMCVPALELLKATEVGHPAYQHPQRLREGTYGLHIDRFSHLVIYTALRSLVTGGRGLWEKYDNGDNLLFSQKDFEKPQGSALFQELLKLNDPEVKKLVQAVASAAQKPVEQTALLDELVSVHSAKPTAIESRIVSERRSGPQPVESPFASAMADRPSERAMVKRNGKNGSVILAVGVGVVAVAALLVGGYFLLSNQGAKQSKSTAVAQNRPGTAGTEKMPVTKQSTTPETKRQLTVAPQPAKVHLADMKEFDLKMGPWPFGKGKIGPGTAQIKIGGTVYPSGLSMPPPSNGYSSAKYMLNRKLQSFHSSVALMLSEYPDKQAASDITFQVYGDGKLLWSSQPTKRPEQVQSCTSDVSQVDVLELRVNCPGGLERAWAVWLDSHVWPKETTTSPAVPNTQPASSAAVLETLKPISVWTFEKDTKDGIGSLHGTLQGGAVVEGGSLKLNGTTAYMKTGRIPVELREKTLEAWVRLSQLEQGGGSVVSVDTSAPHGFDGIVYAELQGRKWMAGSNNFVRTQALSGPDESAKPGERVHIAIVYGPANTISFYRNGTLYGTPYAKSKMLTFKANEAIVLFGVRCLSAGGAPQRLAGDIDEARIYNRALTAKEIDMSFRAGPQ